MMKRFTIFVIILSIWILGYMIAPILMLSGFKSGGTAVYYIYSWACHQMPSRSYCVFSDATIGDCNRTGFVLNKQDVTWGVNRPEGVVDSSGVHGYKFAVCSRCFWFYIGLLLGGLAYAYVNGPDDTEIYPAIFLILAIIPLAIDGVGQLLGYWTSTNLTRAFTGFLSGSVGGLYAVPIINKLDRVEVDEHRKNKKKNRRKQD